MNMSLTVIATGFEAKSSANPGSNLKTEKLEENEKRKSCWNGRFSNIKHETMELEDSNDLNVPTIQRIKKSSLGSV